MSNVIYVGIGGFLGAVLRYALGSYIHSLTKHLPFYFSTLTVNILGCVLIGLLTGFFESQKILNPEIRLFLMLGLLGSFTTFSTFSLDTLVLFGEDRFLLGILNVFSHVLLGLGGVFFGREMIALISKKI